MEQQQRFKKAKSFTLKKCSRCGQSYGPESYAPTKSVFFADGVLPICNDCVHEYLRESGVYDWGRVDKICQMADIPFIPNEWVRILELNPVEPFFVYAKVFLSEEYEGIGWSHYYEAYLDLRARHQLEDEIPLLVDEKYEKLGEKWGKNYDREALNYLDGLYRGLLSTQNVNGKLQQDQAEKICKISYEIDCRIREGSDFDKLLSSYDKLVKAGDFTPKNVKNLNDFDTCGELVKWLEKRGWVNEYYDNVPKDIVDETLANIQACNQRLYTNETGIGDEITRRLASLKQAEQLERGNYYTEETINDDTDQYEVDGYNKLLKGFEDDEFDPGGEDKSW